MNNLQFGLACLAIAAAAGGFVYWHGKRLQTQGDDAVVVKKSRKSAIVRTVVFGVALVALWVTRNI